MKVLILLLIINTSFANDFIYKDALEACNVKVNMLDAKFSDAKTNRTAYCVEQADNYRDILKEEVEKLKTELQERQEVVWKLQGKLIDADIGTKECRDLVFELQEGL